MNFLDLFLFVLLGAIGAIFVQLLIASSAATVNVGGKKVRENRDEEGKGSIGLFLKLFIVILLLIIVVMFLQRLV